MEDRDAAPQDGAGIWRYMSVARFLTLVGEGALYFARLHELRCLGDRSEGVWTEPCSRQVLSGPNEEFKQQKVREYYKRALISCWHENERESVAMWELYVPGGEGVAIRTTVGKLECELKNRNPRIGRVPYKENDYRPSTSDYEGIPFAAWFLFRKNPAYEHEREIRVVLFDNGDSADVALDATIFGPSRPDEAARAKLGEPVPINLAKIIQRIVVSPEFPKWAIRSLQNVVDSAKIGVKVEESSLLDQPSAGVLY